jgi:hypothetical protein
VYNIPHKREEGAIYSLVPYEGYCVQIAVGERNGINRPILDTFMQTNMFADFSRRKRSKPFQLVFVVEDPVYDRFRKQRFHDTN